MQRLLLSLLLAAGIPAAAPAAALTVQDYCELTRARLELSAVEWQERIAAAEQAKTDSRMLLTRSQAIRERYAGYHRQLHSKFGTSPRQYLHFATDHAREIESYLEEHPDVKRSIGDARQKVLALMQRFDSLAESALARGTAK